MENPTEHLLGRARDGDQAAVAQLLQREEQRLIVIVASVLRGDPNRDERVRDVLAQVHLTALRKIPEYDYRGSGSFGRWLAGIARREALNYLRQEGNRAARSMDATGAPDVICPATTPSAEAIRHEMRSALQQALDRLSEDHRTVILLRSFSELSSAEVAAEMGRSEEAVRALYYRAMNQLGGALKPPESRE